jgi:cytochrome c biogenesis protein CcdA
MSQTTGRERSAPAVAYVLLVAGVVALAVAGYAGYVLYPRFGLPAGAGAGLLVLAVAAGAASFFSPCSFPLLVTLLARETGVEGPRTERRSPLWFALALAGGAATLLLAAGLGIAAGGSALFGGVTFTSTAGRTIRIVVGSVLVVLGLLQWEVIPVRVFAPVERAAKGALRRQAQLRRRNPVLAFWFFGFVYLLAGFG